MDMETATIVLLALVTLIAVIIALVVASRSRATTGGLKALIATAREMTDGQSGPGRRAPPNGELSELSEALELLKTRLAKLETDIESEREKLAALQATVAAGVIVLDRERQVTTLNKTAAQLFRAAMGAAAGLPFINLTRDHEIDGIAQRCLETNQKQTGVVQLAGSKQYIELTAVPLRQGALVLVQDLTNIRRLEKVRQDFISNISHELRTPIASCKAIVETLQDGAINDKKVAEDFLQRMQVETDKLAQMVNELGELSRIESGELTLKLEPVDMAAVIARVTERLRTQADRAQLSVDIDIPRGLPPVTGDTNRIEQVLVNLVHNAIKFTPPNGKITISSGVRDDMVLISVADTGIGIPEDDLPHIFERFYKVDKARSGGGTGLGLAIAKHIVQAHGGDIRAESIEGKGSTFTFSLPIVIS
jgi:two-component system phosphate regulon sensor histidine kinase PhoR